MTDGKIKVFDWKGMPEKAQQMLGEDFWGEINRMIPRQGPPIDIYTTEDKVTVIVEVPGLESANRVAVKIKGLKLLISGEIPWTYPVNEKELLQKERLSGSFRREVTLPNDIVPGSTVEARYKAGLLEINIPRLAAEEEQPISIEFEE
ncbi:MAG TPA: Hsp20/alpha crystallin family protein [Clostridia bacterium]|nr:Hsp20/alpha crystallin family protein [Clostridia bacterium]